VEPVGGGDGVSRPAGSPRPSGAGAPGPRWTSGERTVKPVAGARIILYRGWTKWLPPVFPDRRAGPPCPPAHAGARSVPARSPARVPLELPMTAPLVLTARALLLDMDGTLVNSDASVERVWRRWAGRHGLDGDEVMKVVHGRQGYASMALLLP